VEPSLVFKYGFAIVFACAASTLIFWIVRKLILNMIRSSTQKDVLITNHIAHLTDAVLKSTEKIDNLRLDFKDGMDRQTMAFENGLDRVASTFESGLDRQTKVFDKVLDKSCPIVNEQEKKDG
jgi:hypothetical protein